MYRAFARFASVACLLLLLAGAGRCDPLAIKVPAEGEDKPDPAHVEQLIQQLGDNDFFEREAASSELENIGEPVLETLRKVADFNEDLEVQHRADVLVDRIEVKLGMTRGPASCEELVGHLTDSKYPHYREWAASQLGFVMDGSRPAAVEALLRSATQDSASNVRIACIHSLAKLGVNTDEVQATLKKLKADKDSRVADEATKALTALAQQLPPPSDGH
jgi:HEAT repeat protein